MRPLFQHLKFNFQNVLAGFIIICCFALLLVILQSPSVASSPHAAEIRTIAQSVLILVINYYFGSSKGSKTKDETISQIAKNENTTDAIQPPTN